MSSLSTPNGSSGAYGAAPARQRVESPTQQTKAVAEAPITPKHARYGLPCAKCKTYYSAELSACPICKSPQRVSPTASLPTSSPAEQLPDPEKLAQERERFLNEFKAQIDVSPLPSDLTSPAQHCNRVENHGSGPQAADICQGCYDKLQERADVLEAALHIDIAEAAQIVYDAVWSDPSDPSKTYQNAAQALLTELRRRSGVPQVFGPLQTQMN